MGIARNLPLTKQSYPARSFPFDSERLINLFYEIGKPHSKSPGVLYGAPGLTLFSNIGNNNIYGMHAMNGLLYVVSGDEVYTIDNGGSPTLLGGIGTVQDNVIMDDNGIRVVILKEDGAAYLANPSTVVQITDVDYKSSSSVTVLDGYGIFTEKDTNKYFISGLLDLSTYDPLEFSSAEEASDNLVRTYANHGELWLFGERTTEVHYNSGTADFPFTPIGGAAMERGCGAKRSVADDDNTLFWLGDDLIVYRANGYVPQRISTHAVEKAMAGYSDVSDAFGFIYSDEGHKFYCLTFPTAEATWVYDIATQLWHERQSFEKGRWRANAHSFVYNKNLVGDFESGKIYEIDLDSYTEDGATIQSIMITPNIYSDKNRITYNNLWLDMETGVGLNTGQGSDPQVMMQFSDDGGKTFSYERWRPLGKIGDYTRQVNFRQIGQARQRVFKIVISDPVKRVIMDGAIELRVGSA